MKYDHQSFLLFFFSVGELTFEAFSAELERRKKAQARLVAPVAPPARPSVPVNIPEFDHLLKDDESPGEEEDVSEEEEGEEDRFLDSGQVIDKKDKEWVPDEDSPGAKGSKKRKTTETGIMIRKAKRPRRKPHELPKHLKGVQGRAMLLRAQGHTEEAILLLFDIISKAPKAAAPYQALGSIHEEKGDMKQALKFWLVSANLERAEPKEWFELIDMCLKLNNEKLAMTCYLRAMKVAKTKEQKFEIVMHKAAFLDSQCQPPKALQCREQALTYMSKDDPEAMLAFGREVAQEYLKTENLAGAIDTMTYLLNEVPLWIDAEDIHLLVELLMSQQSYEKSLDILVKHCGVTVTFDKNTSEGKPPTLTNLFAKEAVLEKVEVPELMPVDLRSKLVQAFILIKSLPTLAPLTSVVKSLAESDVEEFGDIHFDIAETMVECGYHDNAKAILQRLVDSKHFAKAEVWLTFAHCLNALGDIQASADAYRHVVELAPNHYAARVTLASLQQQMGHNEEALEVLSQNSFGQKEGMFDQNLLLHKCKLLYSQGRTDDFITSCRKLLSYNMRGEYSPDFVKMLLAIKRTKSRQKFFQSVSGRKGDGEVPDEICEQEKVEQNKFKESMWGVYIHLIKVLREREDEKTLLQVAVLGVTCPAWCRDEDKVKKAEFLCLKIGPVNQAVYNLARNLVGDHKDQNQAWNLYNYVTTRFKDAHDLRFAMRALMKNPNSIALGMLNGNARLISGSYKLALGEYLAVFRQAPNALAALCCALCLLHITSQIHLARRNTFIPQVSRQFYVSSLILCSRKICSKAICQDNIFTFS